jgi:hypothetical protein
VARIVGRTVPLPETPDRHEKKPSLWQIASAETSNSAWPDTCEKMPFEPAPCHNEHPERFVEIARSFWIVERRRMFQLNAKEPRRVRHGGFGGRNGEA